MKRFVALIIVILMLAGTACQTNVDIVNSGKSVTSDTSAVRKDAASGTSPYQEEPIKAITSTSPVVTTSRTRDNPDHISKWFGDIQLSENEARDFVKFLKSDSIARARTTADNLASLESALLDFDEYSVEVDTLNQLIEMGVEIEPASYMKQIVQYADLAYDLVKKHYTTALCALLGTWDFGDSETGDRVLQSQVDKSETVVDFYDLSNNERHPRSAIQNGEEEK